MNFGLHNVKRTDAMILYFSIVFGSFVTISFGGVDFLGWTDYTVRSTSVLELIDNRLRLDPIANIMVDNMGIVRRSLYTVLGSTFRSFFGYAAIALIVKGLAIYYVGKLVAALIGRGSYCYIVAALFVSTTSMLGSLSMPTLGTGLMANEASLASILIFAGTYMLLRKIQSDAQVIAGASFLGLAFHFHIFNAAAYLLFLFPSLAIYWSRSGRVKNLGIFLSCLLVVLLPILVNATRLVIHDKNMPLAQWHHWLMATDPDDLSIIYALTSGGLKCLFPLVILIGARALAKPSMKDLLRQNNLGYIILIGSVATAAAFFCLEYFLHQKGVFLGFLSEAYISVQPRRGLWLPFFIAFVLSLDAFRAYLSEHRSLLGQLLFLLCVALIIRWNEVFATIVSGLLAIEIWRHKRLESSKKLLPLAACLGYFFLTASYLKGYMPHRIEFVSICCIVIVGLGYALRRLSALQSAFALFVLMQGFMSIWAVTSVKTAYHDFLKMRAHGFFENLSYLELKRMNSGRRTIILNFNDPFDDNEDFFQVLERLKSINIDGQLTMIDGPANIRDVDFSVVSRSPVYFQRHFFRWYAMFNRQVASLMDERMKGLFGVGFLKHFVLQTKVSPDLAMKNLYHRIPLGHLLNVMTREKIKFFVTDQIIQNAELVRIYEANRYSLYQLIK